MNLIVEGPDSSGKSTLALKLRKALAWPIQSSEGPEQYPREIQDRYLRYLGRDQTIFDRHPGVSQNIYGQYRLGATLLDPTPLYESNPFFIYCPGDGLLTEEHIIKEHDSPEHLRLLTEYHWSICQDYDKWALQHANWIQRKQDPVERLIAAIEGITC